MSEWMSVGGKLTNDTHPFVPPLDDTGLLFVFGDDPLFFTLKPFTFQLQESVSP